MFNNFFPKMVPFMRIYKNTGGPHITIWRMSIACWIPIAADTLSEYVSIILYTNNGCPNAPEWYVLHTLPISFSLKMAEERR
jgi:hypothetical protein